MSEEKKPREISQHFPPDIREALVRARSMAEIDDANNMAVLDGLCRPAGDDSMDYVWSAQRRMAGGWV